VRFDRVGDPDDCDPAMLGERRTRLGRCARTPITPAVISLATRSVKVQPVSMIVKAEGPSGRAKIHSADPEHALGLVQYLRTIGYKAWIEDTNGNEIEETALKKLFDCPHR
jgi:hypothetical protein